ncbi:hypothetical protein NEDG_00667 [Nematocida displodere]|uniref:Rad21/Rec8-like protein N-terminal domain-containing protein n=1 Tax=Nematocida displodere TaxID=1805483 RepID=A0A177EC58_9MICR|nr:hypothetical protein NEDG_00667 [Nematocida displodere]
MFYAVEVLSRRGKLSAAWIAAHFDRRLTKSEVAHASIAETVDLIQKGKVPELALRTSSHILLGLSKLFFRKTKMLYEDCTALFSHITHLPPQKTSPATFRCAPKEKITVTPGLRMLFLAGISGNNRSSVEHTTNSLLEIEAPRASFGASLGASSFNCSFSLNDISLSDAVTLDRPSIFNDSISLQNQTTLNTVEAFNPPSFNDPESLPALPEEPPKRKLAEDLPHKKEKVTVDRTTTVPSAYLKILQADSYPVKNRDRFSLFLPTEIRGFFAVTEAIEEIDGLSMDQSVEIPRGTVISPLHNPTLPLIDDIPPMSLEASFDALRHSIGFETGPEVEAGSSERQSLQNMPQLITELTHHLEGACAKDKALAFFSLLLLVTEGRIEAKQSSPFSPIVLA